MTQRFSRWWTNRGTSRSPGYVLISVLLALALITANLLVVQRAAVKNTTQMAIAMGLAERADLNADLVAVGGSLLPNAPPYHFEEREIWVKLQPAIGLVDLNTAHPALIESILQLHMGDTTDAMSRLSADRTDNAVSYRSVTDAFAQLEIPQDIRGTIFPFFTVATAQLGVAPDRAPEAVQDILRAALTENDLTAPEDDPTDTQRVLIAADPAGPYVSRIYVAQAPDGTPRFAGYAHSPTALTEAP